MNKSKELFKTKWIGIYESEKGFNYCQRASINSVAALIIRKVDDQYEFMIHYQPLPEIIEKKSWDQCFPSTITGSIESNETPKQCIIREILEESGFIINESNILQEFTVVATTQMNEKVFCYLIDVTGNNQYETQPDGSCFEEVSHNKWHSQTEFEQILNNELTLSSLWAIYGKFLASYVQNRF